MMVGCRLGRQEETRQLQQQQQQQQHDLPLQIDDRVRRSIEYLRHTSRLGTTTDDTAFLPRKRMHGTFSVPAGRCAASVPQREGQEVQQPRQDPTACAPRYDEQATEGQRQQDMVPLVQQQQQQRWTRENQGRRRIMLIIDVQSRRGAVEEVHCREGDNCFDLARGFIERRELRIDERFPLLLLRDRVVGLQAVRALISPMQLLHMECGISFVQATQNPDALAVGSFLYPVACQGPACCRSIFFPYFSNIVYIPMNCCCTTIDMI